MKNGKKENTLNYWAGYDITRDDALKLVVKAREAGTKLLSDAGKFSPIKLGDHEVFDLAGSLREMTSEKGKTYGFPHWILWMKPIRKFQVGWMDLPVSG